MSKLIKNYFGALEGEMDYASQQTGRGSDDESIIEQDAGDVWSDSSDGTRLTVEPEDEDEDEDKHSSTESFFMYGSEDEVLIRPLFQKVDLLINDFAETNAAFTKDQVKRYLGAHVCYEHHTKFIGEFKPPQAIKTKLSGWTHLQQLGAQWKALSAEQQRPYKQEAEEEKKRSSNIDMLAKYKSFDRHWKQFRRSADFFRENYRTHLMIYRATDTIHDKLYVPLHQPNSGTRKAPHAAHTALIPHVAHAALTPHTTTRRYPKILKDSDDDYDPDGSFQDGDDSREDNEARAIAPVPSNFSSKSSNALLTAFDPSNSAISADLVQKSNKKLRGSKEQDIKDLRVVAKDAWCEYRTSNQSMLLCQKGYNCL
ncbi:pheromone processing endoprotease [Mucor velutinosus]|uniref:Pheromone processing endoprotease n=1 Tax=Mucor velutinosus TaxID=708070 RepID=A0AAN7DEI7_9FUNG|nr:pheromone processing endoprotease [Mucor velutinosus]